MKVVYALLKLAQSFPPCDSSEFYKKNNSIDSLSFSFLRSPPAHTYSILPHKTRVRRLHSRLEVSASAEIYVSSELLDFFSNVSIIVQVIHV